MNFVFIITDTQNKSLVGAYGNPKVDTPNLDRLAADGIKFDRAYTSCPVCTPARGAIFSGLHPQINGAYCNNVAPHNQTALMGTILSHYGYRAGYTGKWHLDGTAYFGDGIPGGGFEPDWWYDGKRYAEDIGPEMFAAYRSAKTLGQLRQAGFTVDDMWGHRVADRAVRFLEQAGNDPFFLAVAFDEPHSPFFAPPEYWEKFDGSEIPEPGNYFAAAEAKPDILRLQREQNIERMGGRVPEWKNFVAERHRWLGCNSYIDREIGRVINAVDRLHGEDTIIIYTVDHGDQFGAHGLIGKGPMMYEETCCVPFIARLPGGAGGRVCDSVISHVDILPTLLDYVGADRPEVLNGTSLRPIFEDSLPRVRDVALVNFNRFAINLAKYGEFYPVRCAVDHRYKLIINLFETDEFYDLAKDPWERANIIDDPSTTADRDRLHDWLLDEMDRIRDPFRSFRWGDRPWRSVRQPRYWNEVRSNRPGGFPFQAASIDS